MGKFTSCLLPPWFLPFPCPILPPARAWVQPDRKLPMLVAGLAFCLFGELNILTMGSSKPWSQGKAGAAARNRMCEVGECFQTEDYEPSNPFSMFLSHFSTQSLRFLSSPQMPSEFCSSLLSSPVLTHNLHFTNDTLILNPCLFLIWRCVWIDMHTHLFRFCLYVQRSLPQLISKMKTFSPKYASLYENN